MPRELKADKIARAAKIEERMFEHYGEGGCCVEFVSALFM